MLNCKHNVSTSIPQRSLFLSRQTPRSRCTTCVYKANAHYTTANDQLKSRPFHAGCQSVPHNNHINNIILNSTPHPFIPLASQLIP